MKKLVFLLLLIFLFHQSFAQTVQPDNKQQRWKTQRTIGWVLLGTGVTVLAIGSAAFSNNLFYDIVEGTDDKGTGAVVAGLTLMAASIPFFIIAGKNRRLSLNATSFQMLTPLPQQPLLSLQQKPGIQLTFTQTFFQ